MRYLERVTRIIEDYPDRDAFVGVDGSITYAELGVESAKVAGYLMRRGIGREDFVLCVMPRGCHFYSCVLGVWRAGAALVLVQEGYPKDRTDYIRENVGAKLVIDNALLQEILATEEPATEFPTPDVHDAAFAVYTSGSTGDPKGVLHEFGNLDRTAQTMRERDVYPPRRFAQIASLNFVVTYLNLVPATVVGETVFVATDDVVRDQAALDAWLRSNEIDIMFMPPSYLLHYSNPTPCLKQFLVGGAPADHLYFEGGPEILNNYAMSETGFPVFRYPLDKSYEVAPVGVPEPWLYVTLLADDGTIVEGAGEGELVLENPYVRGYIKLPEQTAAAFRQEDGRRMFHTSDICRRDEQGRYFIVGRADDMVKINGNRIEPGEIEATIQAATGLSEVMAKGIVDDTRAYIACYFLETEAEKLGIWDGQDLAVDHALVTRRLPTYMIPTYYVPLREFPTNANGKRVRRLLPIPQTSDFAVEYVEPEGEIERALCACMARVLGLERVGATDDFFVIGGDSMRAIDLVSAVGAEGLTLSSKLLYRLRCARAIAEELEQAELVDRDEREREARQHPWPLLPGQVLNLAYQAEAPTSNFLNIPAIVRLKEGADADRMAAVLTEVIHAHPAFATRIERAADGTLTQRYDEGLLGTAARVLTSEAELSATIERMNAPFDVLEGRLWRAGIIETERAAYLYLVLHHAIVDGAAQNDLILEIFDRYAGSDAERAADHYFALVADATEARESETFEEARAHCAASFDTHLAEIPLGLRFDHASSNRELVFMPYQGAFARTQGHDVNFFMCATALAEAWFNECDYAFLLSIFGNRDDLERMAASGYLASFVLTGIHAGKDATPAAILGEMRNEWDFAITHTDYCHVTEASLDASAMVRFNYQRDLQAWRFRTDIIDEVMRVVPSPIMPGTLGVTFFDSTGGERVGFLVRYARNSYERASIERFVELLFKAVEFLDQTQTGDE